MDSERIENGESIKRQGVGYVLSSSDRTTILLFSYQREKNILEFYVGIKKPRKPIRIVYGEEVTGSDDLLKKLTNEITNNWRLYNDREFIQKMRKRKESPSVLEVRLIDFSTFQDAE